jgi:hypothetical protein
MHTIMRVSDFSFLPANILMVFHKEITEVGRDIARWYAFREWGTPLAATLPPGTDILALADSFPEYRHFAWGPADIDRRYIKPHALQTVDFFLTVTRDDVLRCLNLSAEAIAWILDESKCAGLLEYYRFDDGAVAITSHPRIGLGEFYRVLVESTRPGGCHAWLV